MFFKAALHQADVAVHESLEREYRRQSEQIELIASENIVSLAVMKAQGTLFTNKYAEGYPGRRYYGGCEYVDEVETTAIERVCKLFGCKFANVQAHSGSQANQAVFMSLIKPGDAILGMSLAAGGHLTHGAPPNQSGKWFNAVSYGVRREDALLDYEQIASLARQHKPKLIIAGGSAYSRFVDFAKFRAIADEVGAYLLADMAHFAGLVATGYHPSPFPHAHAVTSTTHKTLRGPRGGIILSNDEGIAKKVNSSIFPGLQGGPLVHVIAAKAVAFGEALAPGYKQYIGRVVDNARTMAKIMVEEGFAVVSGGTDTHLMLVDLRPKNLTGKAAEASLERAYITCNKNGVPFDPQKPMVTSGIRLGTPACTTRGFGEAEFTQVGKLIGRVLGGLAANGEEGNGSAEREVKAEVIELCSRFPLYDRVEIDSL